MVPTKLGRAAEKHEEPWEYQWTNKYKEMMFQSRYLLKTTSNNQLRSMWEYRGRGRAGIARRTAGRI